MRKPAFRKAVRGAAVSDAYSIPAPVGGLNKRDSIATMDELDAVVMDNMFPESNDVIVRKGYSHHVTDIGSQVESLMPYNAPDGTSTLFCAAGSGIYDLTITGPAGEPVVSGLSNARWQHVNFTNSSGTSYLCCFNGEDEPQYWNGTSWISIDGSSTPAITGVTTTGLISASVHKRRMWLVEKNSLKAWYLPVDSVGGAADAIDLGGIASKGGYLMAISTWTVDGGEGMDDYWVGITSEGQLIVYKGTDPSSADTWELVGVWDIGAPLGRRCFLRIESDLLILMVGGIIPLSRILITGRADSRVTLTDRINSVIATSAARYRDNFGWEMMYYSQANMLLLNIPVAEGSNQIQYAMNTITKRWGGPFYGLSANCWCVFEREPYFGNNGNVSRFWEARDDNGENINFESLQAFSYLGARGVLKQVNAVRPTILASGNFDILMNINVDFDQTPITGLVQFQSPIFAVWDEALWDGSLWGGGLSLFNDWQAVSGVGTALAIAMKGALQGIEFRYQAADVVYERGGMIG